MVEEEEEVSGEGCVLGCVDGRSGCCCGGAGSGIVGGRAMFIELQVEGKEEREGGVCIYGDACVGISACFSLVLGFELYLLTASIRKMDDLDEYPC